MAGDEEEGEWLVMRRRETVYITEAEWLAIHMDSLGIESMPLDHLLALYIYVYHIHHLHTHNTTGKIFLTCH